MVTFSIDVNDLGATRQIRNIRKSVTDDSLIMIAIARFIVATSKRSFVEEADPISKQPWEPLAPSTIEKKGFSRILFEFGVLERDIFFRIDNGSATVFSPVPYASFQQFGENRRRFIGVGQEDESELVRVVNNVIERVII